MFQNISGISRFVSGGREAGSDRYASELLFCGSGMSLSKAFTEAAQSEIQQGARDSGGI